MVERRKTRRVGQKDRKVDVPNIDVKAALRKSSRLTSIEALKDRGLKQVKVLNSRQITGMINEAVSNTIQNYTKDFAKHERRQIEKDAKREFIRLMEVHQEVVASRDELAKQRELLEEQVKLLHSDISSQQEKLAREKGRAIEGRLTFSEAEMGGLQDRLVALMRRLLDDEALDRLGEADNPEHALQEYMHRLASEFVDDERERARAHDEATHKSKISLLEQRIRKLVKSLEVTEKMLQDVKSGKAVDEGIASLYRTVQGLDRNDENFQKKKELLKEVFRYNVQLQKQKAVG